MQVLLLLSVVCAVFAEGPTGYPTVDPDEFNCATDVNDPTIDRFYPHKSNCSLFYRCTGILSEPAYLYKCNTQQEVFAEERQMCVYPWDTYPPCGTKQSSTGTTESYTGTFGTVPTTTPDPNPFLCDNLADGYYPNPKACDSFYICNDDVVPGQSPSPVPCPSPLIYNPEKYYCDWVYNVPPPCGTKTLRDSNGPACKDEERYECNGATTPVADEENCQIFYNCDTEIQRVCPSKCPAGLCFDSSINACNWSKVAPNF